MLNALRVGCPLHRCCHFDFDDSIVLYQNQRRLAPSWRNLSIIWRIRHEMYLSSKFTHRKRIFIWWWLLRGYHNDSILLLPIPMWRTIVPTIMLPILIQRIMVWVSLLLPIPVWTIGICGPRTWRHLMRLRIFFWCLSSFISALTTSTCQWGIVSWFYFFCYLLLLDCFIYIVFLFLFLAILLSWLGWIFFQSASFSQR